MHAQVDEHASYKLLGRELAAQGYSLEEYFLGDELVVSFVGSNGKAWTTRAEHLSYPVNSGFITYVSKSKHIAYQFAEHEGMTVPRTLLVGPAGASKEAATAFLTNQGVVIVKPNNASLSNGFTRDIRTPEQLEIALKAAQAFDDNILVQQQVEGEEVRFVVLNGTVIAAVIRQSAQVCGDGTSTLRQLIEHENKERAAIRTSLVPYPQLDASIVDPIQLESSHVPEAGEVVKLSTSTMIKGGASMFDILSTAHKTHVHAVERLTKKLGAGFLVVDMFIGDVTCSTSDTTAYFMEFNTAPALKLFYSCRDGKHVAIVPQLTNMIDRVLQA